MPWFFKFKNFYLYSLYIILLGSFSLLILPSQVFAQTQTNQKSTEQVLKSIINSMAGCMVAGISFIPEEPCKDNPTNSFKPQDNRGALGYVFQGISITMTPPLSTKEYLADVGINLGIIKDAHAQSSVSGSGNNVILPVKRLWSIMRNLSYFLFTFIFLVIGFMIMFRRKLNPQTVVTLQSALPGLVIGLALVTFSYLIAAAIIDLTFVLIPVVAAIFQSAGENIFMGSKSFILKGTDLQTPPTLIEFAKQANFLSILKTWIENSGFYVPVFPDDPTNQINQVKILDPGTWLTPWIQNFFGALLDFLKWAITHAVNLFIGVAVIIALGFQMVKLFAMMVKSYITILVFTFMGPLIILVSAIPGRGNLLSSWWKGLLANALIFPAVFAGFFFGGLILSDSGIDQNAFSSTLPFFAGLPIEVFKYIIGLGIILGIPAIPKMVKDALGVKDIAGTFQEAQSNFGAGMGGVGKFLAHATPYNRIMKQRGALDEDYYRYLYQNPTELAKLERPGTLSSWLTQFGKRRHVESIASRRIASTGNNP